MDRLLLWFNPSGLEMVAAVIILITCTTYFVMRPVQQGEVFLYVSAGPIAFLLYSLNFFPDFFDRLMYGWFGRINLRFVLQEKFYIAAGTLFGIAVIIYKLKGLREIRNDFPDDANWTIFSAALYPFLFVFGFSLGWNWYYYLRHEHLLYGAVFSFGPCEDWRDHLINLLLYGAIIGEMFSIIGSRILSFLTWLLARTVLS